MRHLIIAIVVGLFATALQAEVYKWVDKDGKVHYGDKPKHNAEQVETRPGSNLVEEYDPNRDEALKAAAANAEECARRKAQLATYRKAASIKETDSLGRTKEYTETERQQLINLTEQQVAAACGGAEESAAAQ